MTEEFDADIDNAVKCLLHGGVILYPTDTVWGIGCDSANEEAVKRIFEIKRRPESKAMISLVADTAMFERFAGDLPEVALTLVEEATQPLTLVVSNPQGLAPSLLAEDGSAGLRVTAESFSRELCRRLRRPLVSTSANISGAPTPRFFNEIDDEVKDAVDYVVRYRRDDTEPRRSSSVIKINPDASFSILRM